MENWSRFIILQFATFGLCKMEASESEKTYWGIEDTEEIREILKEQYAIRKLKKNVKYKSNFCNGNFSFSE